MREARCGLVGQGWSGHRGGASPLPSQSTVIADEKAEQHTR